MVLLKQENLKYVFLKYISEEVLELEQSKLYYKYFVKEKLSMFKNVYCEKNKKPNEMAMKQIITNKDKWTDKDKSAIKLDIVLKLNTLLGLNSSYDYETIIGREKFGLLKEFIKRNYDDIKTVFVLNAKYYENMSDEKYNNFVFYMIKNIYFNFLKLIKISP